MYSSTTAISRKVYTQTLSAIQKINAVRHYHVHALPSRRVSPMATACTSSSSSTTNSTIYPTFQYSPKRFMSDKAEPSNDETQTNTDDDTPKDTESTTTEETAQTPSKEEELETQLKELKDQLLRSLAEQENIRRIAKRDVENARTFAISSFAKSLLDTSDNLSRAMDAVPLELRSDDKNHPVLATLYQGIEMTEGGLDKAFRKNGLVKFGEVGEKFDPNLHEALFEYVGTGEDDIAGNIGQVMKIGFMLNDRVVRPAEVGVIKKM